MKLWGVTFCLMLLVAGCGTPPPPSPEALAVRKHVVKLQEHLAEHGIAVTEDLRERRAKSLNNLQRSAALHREGLSETQAAAVKEAINAAHAYFTFENQAETLPMEIIQLEARCMAALRRAAEVLQDPTHSVRRAK